MSNTECEVFIYEKWEFERAIMCWFKHWTAIELKRQLDNEIGYEVNCFKTAVYKRILNFKNGKDWFISTRALTSVEKQKEREELLAIWKFGINCSKGFYLASYEYRQVDEDDDDDEERPEISRAIDYWFYVALKEADTELETENINENQYLIRCNNMKKHKKIVEDLLSACVCSAMGRQNKARIGEADVNVDVFSIICLPCGFLD
jgi:hypothetical protein